MFGCGLVVIAQRFEFMLRTTVLSWPSKGGLWQHTFAARIVRNSIRRFGRSGSGRSRFRTVGSEGAWGSPGEGGRSLGFTSGTYVRSVREEPTTGSTRSRDLEPSLHNRCGFDRLGGRPHVSRDLRRVLFVSSDYGRRRYS